MKETRTLEYKETITNTFLKTVSAFANYDGGVIVFGIADNGAISVNNASIGETQLSEDVNAALALADTSFQMSAVKAAAEGGDGQYALTMTVGADNSITYQWNKISYGD